MRRWGKRAAAAAGAPPRRPAANAPQLLGAGALALAAALRLGPLLLGRPQWHPDEFNYVYWPLLFLTGDPRPDFYYYPHFHYYLLAALYALFLQLRAALDGWDFGPTLALYYFWRADAILLLARAVSALMGVGTVAWLGLIGRRLYGPWAGLATAALAATSVLGVRQAPLAADVPMSFWSMAALWAALRLVADSPGGGEGRRRARDYALAGLFVGLAAGSKYHGALAAVAIAAAHLGQPRRWRLLALAALVAVSAFALTSPYIWLEQARFTEDFGAVVRHVAGGRGDLGVAAWYHARFTLRHNLGWLGAALALAGSWRAAQSAAGRVLLCCFAAYYAAISWGQLVFVRYALPVAALQCVLAGGGLLAVRRRWRAALLALALVQPLYGSLRVAQLLAAEDARAQARQWLEEHVPAGTILANFGGWAGDPQVETFENLWWRTKYFVWHAGYERLEEALLFFEQEAAIPPIYHYAVQAGNARRAHGSLALIGEFAAPYAVLHRHLLASSRIDSAFAAQLEGAARRVASFAPEGLDGQRYDPLDAYYVPLAGFGRLRQPGPALEIWRVRGIAAPAPRSISPTQALAGAYMSGAREALQQGDPSGYLRLAARALRLDPAQRDARYHLDLGVAHRRLGHFRTALAAWRRALQLDSTLAVASYNSGLVYHYDLGDEPQALAAWRRALRQDESYAPAREQLAVALRRQGRSEAAARHWRRLLELEPDNARAYYHLGLLFRYDLGDAPQALAFWRRALHLEPDHWEARYNLALLLYEQGRYEQALGEWRTVVAQRPAAARAHNGLAATYKALGRYPEAARAWREALRQQPDYATAHFNLGQLYLHQLGDLERARAHFARALELRPDHPQAGQIEALLRGR